MKKLNNCPRCKKEKARVSPLYGVLIGLKCVEEDRQKRQVVHAPEFTALTMQTRVQEQRDKHEKDILPPYDFNGKPSEEFKRAFPAKAKEIEAEYERVTNQNVE